MMQTHHFPDLSSMALQMEDHNLLPGQSGSQQWDAPASSMSSLYQEPGTSLSPLGPNSPSLWPPQSMDLDIDIKLEPLDDLLLVDDLLPGHPLGLNPTEDVYLDDVNLDDLLMPEPLAGSSLDQPQSPNTMMAVAPDDVMSNHRTFSSPPPGLPPSGPRLTQPIKAESNSLFSLLASSFPPQGGGWRDPLLTASSLSSQNTGSQLGSIEECPAGDQNHHTMSQPQPQQQQQQQHHQQQQQQQQQQYSPIPSENTSALQELLLRSPTPLSPHSVSSPKGAMSPQEPPMGTSVPRPTTLSAANPLLSARLSSSAPSHNFSLEQAWQRREPRQHLLSTGSLAEELGGSASSLSTVGGILSPSGHDLSIDEGIDSDEASDNEHYDSESDNGEYSDMYKVPYLPCSHTVLNGKGSYV